MEMLTVLKYCKFCCQAESVLKITLELLINEVVCIVILKI